MITRLFLLLICCSLAVPVSAQEECGICKVMIPAFQQHYNAGSDDSVFAMLAPNMQQEFPLPVMRRFLGELRRDAGQLQTLQFRGYRQNHAVYRGGFEKTVLELHFSINNAHLFDGLMVKEYDSLKPVTRNKTPMSLPFKGRWYVNAGGDTKEQNIHIGALAQRRAFDLVVRGADGKTYRTNGERNEDYLAFGREILAPCAGTVVFAIDGIHDNVPGDMNRMYIPGNSVVLQAAGGEYLFFAHFKQGTVRVQRGQQVAKGTVLGLCGNSGNSSEPHLHFHLQDGPDINTAVGMKCYFEQLKVNGVLKRDYSPVKDEAVSME